MDIPINIPGVPIIPGNTNTIADVVALLTADTATIPITVGAQWGIFQDGFLVIQADTVVDFTFKQEWAVSDYAVEKGSFRSYNKVYIPFDARFRFVRGGSEQNREDLLSSIQLIAGDTILRDVVTPEATYPSITITHMDYHRTATNGLGLMIVDVWCLQINEITQSYSGATTPSAAPTQDAGTVQPTAPTGTIGSDTSFGTGPGGSPSAATFTVTPSTSAGLGTIGGGGTGNFGFGAGGIPQGAGFLAGKVT